MCVKAVCGGIALTHERGGYTVVYNDLYDSTAARCLSWAERDLLRDFIRRWSKATLNGKKSVKGILFTWTRGYYPCSRARFSVWRRSLREKGFIVLVNEKSGRYAESDAWQSYKPTVEEAERLANFEALQNTRAVATERGRKGSRVQKLNTPQGAQGPNIAPQTTGSPAQKLDPHMGTKIAPYAVLHYINLGPKVPRLIVMTTTLRRRTRVGV